MQCFSPIGVKHLDKIYKTLKIDLVPCGKCPACIENRLNDWVFRVQQESDWSLNSYFVTLTYNDENLPDYVNKEDVQKFFKRLRQNCKPPKSRKYPDSRFPPLKYFLTSEYGEQFSRPHYHAIIMNVIPLDDAESPHDVIESSWNKGFISVFPTTSGRIRYVLKYMFKDADLPPDKQETIFSLKSNGLGKQFLNEHNKTNISSRDLTYIPIADGKARMPRYFQEKIYGNRRGLVFGKARRLYELSKSLESMSDEQLSRHFIEERQKQIAYLDGERRRRFFQRLGIRYPG